MKPPIKNFVLAKYPKGDIIQYFGDNRQLYSQAVCVDGAPCHESMICPSGKGCLLAHNGLDIVRPWGEPIYAVESGVVMEAKEDAGGFGKHIKIWSFLENETTNEWVYGHLSQILAVKGQRIQEGELIGKMGNTGFVVSGATPFWEHNPYAGTHLHLGKRIYNNGVLNYTNGYFGYLDLYEDFKQYIPTEELRQIETLQMTLISLARQVIALLKDKIEQLK